MSYCHHMRTFLSTCTWCTRGTGAKEITEQFKGFLTVLRGTWEYVRYCNALTWMTSQHIQIQHNTGQVSGTVHTKRIFANAKAISLKWNRGTFPCDFNDEINKLGWNTTISNSPMQRLKTAQYTCFRFACFLRKQAWSVTHKGPADLLTPMEIPSFKIWRFSIWVWVYLCSVFARAVEFVEMTPVCGLLWLLLLFASD